MSTVRQSNLFAAEDFTKIYKSFQDINFTAYDFDTIRSALIDYIKIHYPEDFNDYIESSEFIAIIEMLAYLGTSLAFRADVNARENILDTAQRKESVVRLARMLNYQPKRNIAANGLMKVTSVRTTQPITDSAGNLIANSQINWNDPNNINWFDQFTSVLNSALSTSNPFGKPTKSGNVAGVPTDLYEISSVLGLNVSYPVSVNVNGETVPLDIVNPDIDDTIFERNPNPNTPFHLIYKNDSQGAESVATGFFVKFKQGVLNKVDEIFNFPETNRLWDIGANGINNSDVFVQEIDDNGNVIQQWTQVPTTIGSNVIYNSINLAERKIFETISGLNDNVTVKFADGNFGDIPTGTFRTWYRTSLGRKIVIRPDDASNLSITLPYVGANNQQYDLTVTFKLVNTVANGSEAETIEQIKQRAPQVYYTQDRMVNNEDYNVFPLVKGNEIAKLRAINRTHAGHSRYIASNDPTGFHSNLSVVGTDGALFLEHDDQTTHVKVSTSAKPDERNLALLNGVEAAMQNLYLQDFYNNIYLAQVESSMPGIFDISSPSVYWKTSPNLYESHTGFFIKDLSGTNWPYGTGSSTAYDNIQMIGSQSVPEVGFQLIKDGSRVTFQSQDESSSTTATVNNIRYLGNPMDPLVTTVGPVTLSAAINDLWTPVKVAPPIRTVLTESEKASIITRLSEYTSAGIAYDVVNDAWSIITSGVPNTSPGATYDIYSDEDRWVIAITRTLVNGNTAYNYEIVSRGMSVVFSSTDNVRFYWNADEVVIDPNTGNAMTDTISILPFVNLSANETPLLRSYKWDITGNLTYDDGFSDPAMVRVAPTSGSNDGSSETPLAFSELVDVDGEVLFEEYTDASGYVRTRLWETKWIDLSSAITVSLNSADAALDVITSGSTYSVNLTSGNLIIFSSLSALSNFVATCNSEYIANQAATTEAIEYINNTKSLRVSRPGAPGSISNINEFYTLSIVNNEVVMIRDSAHFSRHGVTASQDLTMHGNQYAGYHFKWDHYVSSSSRVDPSPSNIIDAVVLTKLYAEQVAEWKNARRSIHELPLPPTPEELRTQFGELNKYKSMSDELVYSSGKFKLLFGPQSNDELRAVFRAVKLRTSTISDNEIKTQIINAIDEYFNIQNWNFGERFYYTELAAYIHTKLSRHLGTVVIVPLSQSSDFGSLFEIAAMPNELFISTATVSDVEIVDNLTETNMRR